MAHQLEKNKITGAVEFMSAKPAWHRLGQIVGACQTWQEASRIAGLEWSISKQQLEFAGIEINAMGLFRDDYLLEANRLIQLGTPQDIQKAQELIASSFISVTTPEYQPIQNVSMFHYLDLLVQNDGNAHYESAGAINGGKQVFALINLNNAFEIGTSGDRWEDYLLFTDDRTGKRSGKCFRTRVRVVCANTLEQAINGENAEESVTFTHKGNMNEKMFAAADLFVGSRMNTESLREKLRMLSERQIDSQSLLIEVLDKVMPPSEDEETKRARLLRENKQADIVQLFSDNDGNMFPEQKNTAYNLFNAITQWTDHFAPVKRGKNTLTQSDDKIRAERAMLGAGVDFKANALDIILDATKYAPTIKKVYSTPAGQQVGVIELEAEAAKPVAPSLLDEVFAVGVRPSNN
jgi:phage/plasmid-like protein (TIGR03299 family)